MYCYVGTDLHCRWLLQINVVKSFWNSQCFQLKSLHKVTQTCFFQLQHLNSRISAHFNGIIKSTQPPYIHTTHTENVGLTTKKTSLDSSFFLSSSLIYWLIAHDFLLILLFFAKLVVFVPFMERIWSRYWTKVQRFGRKWDKIGPLNQIKGRKFCKKGAKTGLFAWEMGNLYEGSVASPFQPPPTSSRPSPPRFLCK